MATLHFPSQAMSGFPHQMGSRSPRRPALIPYNSDLSQALSQASAALNEAKYSPARNLAPQLKMGVFVLAPPQPVVKCSWEDDMDSYDMDFEMEMDQPEMDFKTLPKNFKFDSNVRGDVFSWVNTPNTEDVPHVSTPPLDEVPQKRERKSYFDTDFPTLDADSIPSLSSSVASHPDTAPTSPVIVQNEFQKRPHEEVEEEQFQFAMPIAKMARR